MEENHRFIGTSFKTCGGCLSRSTKLGLGFERFEGGSASPERGCPDEGETIATDGSQRQIGFP